MLPKMTAKAGIEQPIAIEAVQPINMYTHSGEFILTIEYNDTGLSCSTSNSRLSEI